MFYRLILKEGISLLNMRHVREVAQRGAVLTVHFQPITDGNGILGQGVRRSVETYTYDSEKAAKEVLEEIHRVCQAPAPMPLK